VSEPDVAGAVDPTGADQSTGGAGAADEPEIVVLPDPEACSRLAAERIAGTLADAVAARGGAHWATTGGSTPAGIYRHLATAPLRNAVPWDAVELWWGDDRFVPSDHPLSNAKLAADVLLEVGALSGESGTGDYGVDVLGGRRPGAPIPALNIHYVPVAQAIADSDDVDWCAARYAEMVAEGPPIEAGWPVFDVVLLGVGPDGHILSVFPGSATFDRRELALGVPAPSHVEPHVARVTLNPAIVGAARTVIVVSHGDGKADILREVLHGPRDPRRLPAQLARRSRATWILDAAAARQL
jgi:6-phosphogluconolactonase